MSAIMEELKTFNEMQSEIKRLNGLLEASYSMQEAQAKEINRLREALQYYESRPAD